MTEQQLNFAKNKYPDIFDGNSISLKEVGNRLNLVNSIGNDIITLNLLGLENFKSDIRYIFGDIKNERKQKLKKLNNDN